MDTLHPDLIPYVGNGMVHHPLVVRGLASDASSINQFYREKLDEVKKADADGNWGPYVGSTSGLTVSTLCSLQLRKVLKALRILGIGGRGVAGLRKHPSKSEQVEATMGDAD